MSGEHAVPIPFLLGALCTYSCYVLASIFSHEMLTYKFQPFVRLQYDLDTVDTTEKLLCSFINLVVNLCVNAFLGQKYLGR